MTTKRASFNRRLQKLEAREKAPRFHIVCKDEIEIRAKARMRPKDLEILPEALAQEPRQLTYAHRLARDRWERAREEVALELQGNDDFIIVLSAADCRL